MPMIPSLLLAWYDENAREMPWRGIHNPYYTWVSETMLQQTRVETVVPYYHRFLARFPTLAALAEGPEEDVLKEWEGLGYYSRARNLLRGARQVMAEYGGELPTNPEALRKITGIGPYTAGAIASIAYELPVPAVDGNVIRVLSRLYDLRENPQEPKQRKQMEALAASLVPAERPGDYNQAVMDLGAMICTPGTPDCDRCPLMDHCAAFRAGNAAELPNLPQAKAPKVISYDVLLLRSGERVLMRQRTEKLLQGLWCFPMLEANPEATPDAAAWSKALSPLTIPPLTEKGGGKHVFTHQVWQMRVLAAQVPPDTSAPKGYVFIPLSELDTLPLPVAMKLPRILLFQCNIN